MSIDVHVLSETYTILKQYIPVKDRQEASDNVMSVLVDMMEDADLRELGETDGYLKKSLAEYLSDSDDAADYDDDYE